MRRKLIIFTVVLVILSIGMYFTTPKRQKFNSCSHLTDLTSKKKCWEEDLENVLVDKGIDGAFDLVNHLYKNEPLFAADCHSYIHLVGEKGYQVYSQGQKIKLSSKASTCGYGFYHGFMETLLLSGKDIKELGQFCDWAQNQVGGKNDVKGACFHGIGHGLSENHDEKYWRDETELVNNPLRLCETITEDEYMVNRCASGVFNVLSINYLAGYLPINKQDPLAFCKKQTKPYFKKPCFEEMNTMLISISGNDILKAAGYLNDLEDIYAASAMRSLASVVGMGFKDTDYSLQIQNCRKLNSKLHITCIIGFAGGLIEGESSNAQGTKALLYCSSPNLRDEEKTSCYQETLRLLSLYLPFKRYQEVCRNLDEKYQNFCDY